MAEKESIEQLLARVAAYGYTVVPTTQASPPAAQTAKAAPSTTNRSTTQIGLGTPSTAVSNLVSRSFSASRVTPAPGTVPASQSRPSLGRVPTLRAASASHPTASKVNNLATPNPTIPNNHAVPAGPATSTTPATLGTPAYTPASSGAPGVLATVKLPLTPVVRGLVPATTEPPPGDPPTYVASILHDGFLQRASGGLLSRTTPIVFAVVPEEPSGSPGRGDSGYQLWKTLQIPKSVHLAIWGIVRTVYMRSPDIDTNLSFTNQRPKGIAEQVLIEEVLPLLPELRVYEKYGYWPLFKYGLSVLRSTSNLYQRQLAKLNPNLKSKKTKKSGGKKEKGKGKTRSRAPVKSSKMEVDDEINSNSGDNSGDAAPPVATEDDVPAEGGTEPEAAADDDEGLSYHMNSLHLAGSDQAKEKEDNDDDIPMGNMLPADLTGRKMPPVLPVRSGRPQIFQQPLTHGAYTVAQPAIKPTVESTIDPVVKLGVEPTIEPAVEPTVESAVENAAKPVVASYTKGTSQLTAPVAIHNTATATASSMSSSSATATFATPSLPGPSPWGNTATLSPVELLASLQHLPAEYLNTLPPQLAQIMRNMGLGSATISQSDPPAAASTQPDPPASTDLDQIMSSPKPKPKAKPKPRPRPVPSVETQVVDQQANDDFGDSPLTPPSSVLGGDEAAPHKEPSSRGRGGGKPGRGRGRGGAKKSAGHAESTPDSGGSQASAQVPRLTRASSGTTAAPATRGAPAKQRGRK